MEALVLYFGLVLARVATFVSVVPLIGGQAVPRYIKMGLAFVLAIFWYGTLETPAPLDGLLLRSDLLAWFAVGMALVREAILGALLGFAFGLVLIPIRVAGEFITQLMALNFGALIDPTSVAPVGPLTQLLETIASLLFLGLDGHHLFLAVLHGTFARYPLGGAAPHVPVLPLVAGASAAIEWGLLLAAPVALCLFLTTTVLALMTRAAPQLNLYSVGFPILGAVGFAALWIFAPNMLTTVVRILGRYSELLIRMV